MTGEKIEQLQAGQGQKPDEIALRQQQAASLESNAASIFRLGVVELQAKRFESALSLMRRASELQPDPWRYHFGIGLAQSELKRFADSSVSFRRALAMQPKSAEIHFALALSLESQNDLAGAMKSYASALDGNPNFVEAMVNLGNGLQTQGHLQEAEKLYRRALDLRAGDANALANLGVLLSAMGRMQESIETLSLAARLHPELTRNHVNLSAALCKRRSFAHAAQAAQKAIDLDANSAEARYNRGNALLGLGKTREAVDQYEIAVRLKPDYSEAFNNLGNALREIGDFQAAGAAFESAMSARPDCPVAFNNAGCLRRTLGDLEGAQSILEKALLINPSFSPTLNNLGNALKDAGELGQAIDYYRKAQRLNPTDPVIHSNLAYSLVFSATDGQTILDESLRWDALHGIPLRGQIKSFDHDPNPDRRIRVGYLSGDFRDHCLMLFGVPFFSHHDHKNFEVFCYSSVERPDEITQRVRRCADVWRDVRTLDDAELADVIRQDRIDILVDIGVHLANGRPCLLARKPAPIQVVWLAYPGTSGLSAVDYALTDPRLTPAGFEKHFCERIVRLPDTFWCYDPLTSEPSVNELPALSGGAITFGCLNAPYKLEDSTLDMWGGVMREIPESELILMAAPGRHRKRLLDRLASRGISAERVTCLPFRPRDQYLRTYHQIDLGLDTFPYNGHTTTFDSLWMGVPVVTRVGQTAVGRGGLSQLHNLGLTELAAETDEQFIQVAVNLARDLKRLAHLRRTLRPRMRQSPLMDAPRFARNMEQALRDIWQTWCAQRHGA